MYATAHLSLFLLTSVLSLVCVALLILDTPEEPGILDNGASPQLSQQMERDLGHSCLPPLRRLATPCVGPSWNTWSSVSSHLCSSSYPSSPTIQFSDSSTPLDEHSKLIPGPSLFSAAYNCTHTRVARCIACRRLLSPAPLRRFALGPPVHPPVAASVSALLLGILGALTFGIRVDMCLGKHPGHK
jgi:hypothetical protein